MWRRFSARWTPVEVAFFFHGPCVPKTSSLSRRHRPRQRSAEPLANAQQRGTVARAVSIVLAPQPRPQIPQTVLERFDVKFCKQVFERSVYPQESLDLAVTGA